MPGWNCPAAETIAYRIALAVAVIIDLLHKLVMVNHEWQSERLPKKHIEFTIKNNIILKKLTSDLVSVFRGRM
ncbi:MAG: hypothetical protein CDV28_1471, partial [Candidatus Electronema aureum]